MLDRILAHKRAEIERLDLAALRRAAESAPAPRDFVACLTSPPTPAPSGPPLPPLHFLRKWRGGRGRGWGLAGAASSRAEPSPREDARGVRLIAELKRASPSRGLLAPNVDLAQLARTYVENGAAALSVLTDEKFFMGSLITLHVLRFTHRLPAPLLRKEFILSPAQVYETRAAGADAILLIAAALPDQAELADLHALALDLGLTPLVEVHNREELERVVRLPGLRLVGINNRDLRTFTVNLETTEALRPHIPPDIVVVSESGIFTAADVARLAGLSVDAILVGEALVTAPDTAAKTQELAGVPSVP